MADWLKRLAAVLSGGGESGEEKAEEGKETSPKVVDSISAIRKANEELRATAKWILTSFAAVGAILVAGLQLASLGKLTGDVPDARIAAALAGIAAAALGVGIAIWFTSNVLAPFLNSFRRAEEEPEAAARVLADRELVGVTYAELKTRIKQADAALANVADKGLDDPAYQAAWRLRDEWEKSKGLALTAIGSELLWRRYERARMAVIWAIALITIGVVAFAWGANPPEDEKEKPPVALGQAPLLLDLTLTAAGVDALKKARGCATSDLQVLSIAGTPAEREVVTVPAGRCKAVRFVLTPELGTAVAAAP